MQATREELVGLVLSRIDEISPIEQTVSVSPVLIETELDEAALLIIHAARKEMLFPAATPLHETYCLVQYKISEPTVPQSIIIPLSSQFSRYLRLRFKDWKIPSDDIVSVDTNEYRSQFNRFQSAHVMKPSVALIPFYFEYVGEGDLTVKTYNALEAFPAPTTINNTLFRTTAAGAVETAIAAAAALKGMTVLFNTTLAGDQKALLKDLLVVNKMAAENIPEMLVNAVAWKAAEVCLRSLRETELANSALNKCNEALGMKIGLKGEETPVKKK